MVFLVTYFFRSKHYLYSYHVVLTRLWKVPFYLKVIKMKYLFFILQTDEEINRKPVRANNNATSRELSAYGIIFIYIFNKTKGYNNMWIMESLWFCFPGCLPKKLIKATVKPSPENYIKLFYSNFYLIRNRSCLYATLFTFNVYFSFCLHWKSMTSNVK